MTLYRLVYSLYIFQTQRPTRWSRLLPFLGAFMFRRGSLLAAVTATVAGPFIMPSFRGLVLVPFVVPDSRDKELLEIVMGYLPHHRLDSCSGSSLYEAIASTLSCFTVAWSTLALICLNAIWREERNLCDFLTLGWMEAYCFLATE